MRHTSTYKLMLQILNTNVIPMVCQTSNKLFVIFNETIGFYVILASNNIHMNRQR